MRYKTVVPHEMHTQTHQLHMHICGDGRIGTQSWGTQIINRACMTGALMYQQDSGMEVGGWASDSGSVLSAWGPGREAKPCPAS